MYGIFREFSCLLFRRFQKPEISRCYGSPFWGKNEFAKKVIHYQVNTLMMLYCRVHERAWVPPDNISGSRSSRPGYWHPIPWGMLTYALAWAKAGRCEGQITIVEMACDRCQLEGGKQAS